MKYQNYIWDLGGTLIDSYAISVNVFKEILSDFGIITAEDMIYRRMKKSSTEEAAKFFGVRDVNLFMQRYRDLEIPMQEHPILFSGAVKTLKEIVSSGGKNFVISHRDDAINQLLENAGLKPLLTEVVSSDSHFPRKPNPSSIIYLIERYQLNPSETVVIGDRALDIEAGENAGIATILFKSDVPLPYISPDYIITKLSDVTKLK
ncbi:MAG: HAD-IA family hydrolase [Streptococcaceae bacterium]|jgi:HAD superfamily hydrolase (TIGR01549 family)|nr:HAD-IA family hydrolase [Streptococcaceae bacterium]